MSSTASKKWSDMSDVSLLIHIIVKSGTTIPYNDIAAEFGITQAALRSKINRLKTKYKDDNGGEDSTNNDGPAEENITPKKRKKTVKPTEKSQRGKKAKVEAEKENEEGQVGVTDDEEEV